MSDQKIDELDSQTYLSKIIILHEKVTSSIPEINRSFTFQMIFISTICLFKSVLGLYSIFQDLILTNGVLKGYGILYIFRVSICLGLFIHPINAATSLSNEVFSYFPIYISKKIITKF
jgi:hypothetical protein